MNIDILFSTFFFVITAVGVAATVYSVALVVPHMERRALKASHISGLSQLIFALSLLALAVMFNTRGLPMTSGSIVALVLVALGAVNWHNVYVRRAYNLALR